MSGRRWTNTGLLDHLDRVRAPWHGLVRKIVYATLAKALPVPPGLLVEIGAGGGQLRDWLPPHLAALTTHTEQSEPYLDVLRRLHPRATAARAEAANLPFPTGSVGAVLGLCVLDTIPDLPAVRDELRRVLRPGGSVVHVLDLGTSPDCCFPELVAGGEVPLTNFLADPGIRAGLTDAQKTFLPPTDEFDEVLAIGWEPFTRFAGMLEAARHPLAADLGPYSRLKEPGRLDPYQLGQDFMGARGDPARLAVLNRALLGLTLSARNFGREWPLRSVSLRSHLRSRLTAAFGPDHGFAVEFAGPVAAREEVSRWEFPRGVRFVLRHSGRTVQRAAVSEPPGTPVEELGGKLRLPAAGARVRATTVEVLVARRTG